MKKPTCETCPFWEAWDTEPLGECHRFPPTPEVETERRDEANLAWFPVTAESVWCGEHPDFKAASIGQSFQEVGDRIRDFQTQQNRLEAARIELQILQMKAGR